MIDQTNFLHIKPNNNFKKLVNIKTPKIFLKISGKILKICQPLESDNINNLIIKKKKRFQDPTIIFNRVTTIKKHNEIITVVNILVFTSFNKLLRTLPRKSKSDLYNAPTTYKMISEKCLHLKIGAICHKKKKI